MLDLGWTELLLIGIVALIVVGPKDLPMLFKKAGKFVGRLKGMAREFSRAMNDAADEAGVADVKRSFEAASQPLKTGMDSVKKATQEIASPNFLDTKTKESKIKSPKKQERVSNKDEKTPPKKPTQIRKTEKKVANKFPKTSTVSGAKTTKKTVKKVTSKSAASKD